jgi:hypothetical protein
MSIIDATTRTLLTLLRDELGRAEAYAAGLHQAIAALEPVTNALVVPAVRTQADRNLVAEAANGRPAIAKAIKEAQPVLSRPERTVKRKQETRSPKHEASRTLSTMARALMDAVAKHPDCNLNGIADHAGVSYPTAKVLMRTLVDDGRVIATGATHTRRYQLPMPSTSTVRHDAGVPHPHLSPTRMVDAGEELVPVWNGTARASIETTLLAARGAAR